MLDFLDNIKGLIAVIIGGFILKFAFVFVAGDNKDRPFHEVQWDTRKAVCAAIDSVFEHKTLDAFALQKTCDTITYPPPPATGHEKEAIPHDTILARACRKNTNDLYKVLRNVKDSATTLSDSAFNAAYGRVVFMKNMDTLIPGIDVHTTIMPVKVTFMPARLPGFIDSATYFIPVAQNIHADYFLPKYPSLGMLVLLIILQMALYPLLALLISIKLFRPYFWPDREPALTAKKYEPEISIVLLFALVLSAIMVVFAYNLLYADGNTVIRPEYFLFRLNSVFGWVNYPGYICAGLCLAGLLLIYPSIRKIETAQSPSGTTEAEKAKEAENAKKEKEAYYNTLVRRFSFYFTVLSVILTFATLSTSYLFNGVNCLPYVKALTWSFGYSVYPDNTVVLYGLIHSVILLSFYILLRVQLNELKNFLGIKDEDDINKLTLSKKLLDTLITGSPLLGPVLQAVFEQITK